MSGSIGDHERRRFALYCRHMVEMEELSLKGKEKLFESQQFSDEVTKEMTKRDKALIFAYTMVAEDLEKWDRAEVIGPSDVADMELP